MSKLFATIDEELVNAVLANVAIKGTEHREGPKIPVPLAPDPPLWSVTLKYVVDKFHADIEKEGVRFRAQVHAEAKNFSYTDDINGSMTVELRGTKLLIKPKSLKITLYIKPLGKRINILEFDIVDRLPNEAKNIQIELFKEPIKIPAPGGKVIPLVLQGQQLTLKKGAIDISTDVLAKKTK